MLDSDLVIVGDGPVLGGVGFVGSWTGMATLLSEVFSGRYLTPAADRLRQATGKRLPPANLGRKET